MEIINGDENECLKKKNCYVVLIFFGFGCANFFESLINYSLSGVKGISSSMGILRLKLKKAPLTHKFLLMYMTWEEELRSFKF